METQQNQPTRGLLGAASDGGGLLRGAGRNVSNWLNPASNWEWIDRLGTAALNVAPALFGYTVPPLGLDFVDNQTGRPNPMGEWLSLRNPFGWVNNLGGLFNGGDRGAPIPAWMQPGAPMDGNAPWQQNVPGAYETPETTPQIPGTVREGESPYGQGRGVFANGPSGPSYQGNRSAGNVAGTIEGQAARDYVAGMQSPVARNAQLAAQAQAAMERMFGRQYR